MQIPKPIGFGIFFAPIFLEHAIILSSKQLSHKYLTNTKALYFIFSIKKIHIPIAHIIFRFTFALLYRDITV